MFDYNAIKQQVLDYAGEFAADFDIDAIVEDLRDVRLESGHIESIDDVDIDDFMQAHDISGR